MVTCAVCADNGFGVPDADAFVVRRQWENGRFVDSGVLPLCIECLRRRQEMTGFSLELPWDESLLAWNLQQVHES